MVVDWIWRLFVMAFEEGEVSENWNSVVTVPLYRVKGERTEYEKYRGISFKCNWKLYAGILVI